MAKDDPTDDNEIDLEANFDIEEIQDSARKSFRFSDKLEGITHRHAKIPLFTDMEAVDEYQRLNAQAQAVTDAAGKLALKDDAARERHAALLAEYERLEPLVEAAKAKMLESAYSIHLQAWPNMAAKVARRKAVKIFTDPVLGGVPPERAAEASEYVDMQLLGASIVKIVDAQGNEDTLAAYKEGRGAKAKTIKPRETIGAVLSDKLPPSQWQRLYDAYQRLTLTDQISEATTDDPGF